MAIVKMDKFNLISFDYNRSKLLNLLQDFNYVHFNDLKIDDDEDYIKEVKNSETIAKIDEDISKTDFLLDTIKKFVVDKKDVDLKDSLKDLTLDQLNKKASDFKFNDIYEKIKSLVEKRDTYVQVNQNLQSKINEIDPWKNLDIDISSLYGSDRFYLDTGMIPKSYYENFRKNLLEADIKSALVREVSEKDSNIYVYVLSNNEDRENFKEFLREFGFSRIKVNESGVIKEKIAVIEKEKEENSKKIKNIEAEISSFKTYISDLQIYYTYLKNLRLKEESSEYFLKTKKIDYIEGYVPSDMAEKFEADLEKSIGKDKFSLEIKAADKEDEKVPIILKNNKLIKPFESVVDTYALPKYNELDPTPLIAPFYAIYTGFMVGDLGYGLLVVLACIFALNKMKLGNSTKKMVKLVLWMGSSASVFGLLFGSLFGGIVPIPGLIDTQKDFNALIAISLVIAVIAMFFALGIKAYMLIRDGKILDAIFDVGFWYMAVGGAVLMAVMSFGILSKDNINIAKYIMIIGMVGIVLTGGRASKSVGGKIGLGLYDLYGISSWIGDFVSFLRLMALVLSGGFVAYAVNIIVGMVFESGGIFGYIAGSLIFVIFQLFNMFLSYLSAYVHSLRLVYVEMFNKFYEGGGKRFREMVEDTKFVNIIRGGK